MKGEKYTQETYCEKNKATVKTDALLIVRNEAVLCQVARGVLGCKTTHFVL